MMKWAGFAAVALGCLAIIGGVAFVASKQQAAAEKYKAHRKEYCTGIGSFTPEQEKKCEEDSNSPSDYLPWGYKLVAWPEGIATWAFMATLGAIMWQAVETRKAAKATADAANATYGSVAFAEAQFDLMREKERARIDIQSGELKIEPNNLALLAGMAASATKPQDGAEEPWVMKGTFKVRNIGQNRAYIIKSFFRFAIKPKDGDYPDYEPFGQIPFADSFVDPNPDNPEFTSFPASHYPAEGEKLRFIAEDLQFKRRTINLWGFVDYDTLGMHLRKEFGYVWNMIEPTWYMTGGAGGDGQTDAKRITFGYWVVDPEKTKPEYPIPTDAEQTPSHT